MFVVLYDWSSIPSIWLIDWLIDWLIESIGFWMLPPPKGLLTIVFWWVQTGREIWGTILWFIINNKQRRRYGVTAEPDIINITGVGYRNGSAADESAMMLSPQIPGRAALCPEWLWAVTVFGFTPQFDAKFCLGKGEQRNSVLWRLFSY